MRVCSPSSLSRVFTRAMLGIAALVIAVSAFQQNQYFLQTAQADTPPTILVVGDSITQGHSGDYTWRYRLWQHFQATNTTVDFVGPRQTVQDDADPNSTAYIDPNFDRDHGALWGRPIIYEKDTIAATVSAYVPDVMLVNLGTNDLVWWGMTGEQAASQLAELVTNACNAKPDLRIVLSKVTPRRDMDQDYAARWSDFNSRIPSVAASAAACAEPVSVADPVTGFDPVIDTYDGTHPSPGGEYKIAAAFANTLASDLGIGAPYGSLPAAPAWPLAPMSVTAAPLDGGAKIDWTPVAGVDSYYIHTRNVTRGEAFVRLPYPVSGTTFTGGYMINGETYEFAISSLRGSVDGPMSAPVQVVPQVPLLPGPTDLTATPLDGGAQLRWTQIGNSWSYIYTRNVTRGEAFVRLQYPVTSNNFTAGYMINGETYEFKITTINTAGQEGSFSNTASVVPVAPVLPAPTGLTAAGGNASASLSWGAVSGATGYNVYRKDVTAGQTTFTKIASSITSVSYTASSLTNGHSYQFAVSTVNTGGEGALSSAVSATPLAALPAPTGLKVTAGTKSAALSWTKVSGAAYYQIWIRKGSTGSFTKSSKVSGTASSATIFNLTTGSTYYFQISSINANGLEGPVSTAVKSAAIK